MPKPLNIPKTIFSNLEFIYKEVLEVRAAETPPDELNHKKGREINAKITFHHDDCYLTCKEIFDLSSNLVEYYYDWYAGNGQIMQKFHAHYHPTGTPEEIKKFDPWHFHVVNQVGQHDGERRPGIEGYTIHEALQNEILPFILRTRLSSRN